MKSVRTTQTMNINGWNKKKTFIFISKHKTRPKKNAPKNDKQPEEITPIHSTQQTATHRINKHMMKKLTKLRTKMCMLTKQQIKFNSEKEEILDRITKKNQPSWVKYLLT